MLNKVRKTLKSKEGFTLIELITVIVVLAIILGIGIPKYAMIQAQSEWDADVSTLKNLEKAAELYYARNPFAVTENSTKYSGITCAEVKFSDLYDAGQFDEETTLKRKKGATDYTSERNTGTPVQLKDNANLTIYVDVKTGKVHYVDKTTNAIDGTNDWMNELIGVRPK